MGISFEQSSNENTFDKNNEIYKVFTIKSKKDRRDLSKYLKWTQFSSYIKVKLHTFPKVTNYERYNFFDPHNTIRCDVVEMVRRLTMENYVVIAEVHTVL